jgi:hypothetical protein
MCVEIALPSPVASTSVTVVVSKERFISALAAKGFKVSVISYQLKAAVTLNGMAGTAVDYSDDASCGPCVVKRFQLRRGAATAADVDISAVEITSALDGRRRQLQGWRRLAAAVGVTIVSEDHTISDAMGAGFVESLRSAVAAVSASEIVAATGVTAEMAAASVVDTAGMSLATAPSFTTTVTYAFESTETTETGNGSAPAVAAPESALISEALGSLGVSAPVSSISTVAQVNSDLVSDAAPAPAPSKPVENDVDEGGSQTASKAMPKSSSRAEATTSVVLVLALVFGCL